MLSDRKNSAMAVNGLTQPLADVLYISKEMEFLN